MEDLIEDIEIESTIPRALVILAEGAEEAEAVIVVDILRRGGIDVIFAGLNGEGPVLCSRKTRIVAEVALSQVTERYEALVLPGGAEGARRLASSEAVGERLRHAVTDNLIVGAICAAPLALQSHHVFAGKSMTCHPSVASRIAMYGNLVQKPVVEDGQLVTSQGLGTAFLFGLTLVRRIMGDVRAADVERGLTLPR
jgi:DJ-1 family protein